MGNASITGVYRPVWFCGDQAKAAASRRAGTALAYTGRPDFDPIPPSPSWAGAAFGRYGLVDGGVHRGREIRNGAGGSSAGLVAGIEPAHAALGLPRRGLALERRSARQSAYRPDPDDVGSLQFPCWKRRIRPTRRQTRHLQWTPREEMRGEKEMLIIYWEKG